MLWKAPTYVAQPHQMTVASSKARFRVIAAGRRSGKTMHASFELAIEAQRVEDKVLYWVSPFYAQTEFAIREVSRWIDPKYIAEIKVNSPRHIKLINGTYIKFKSADNPDALRGEGVWFMVVDEAAMIKDEVWEQVLRPTLADSVHQGGGRAIIISTPKGMNWFYEMWQDGQNPENYPQIESFHFPTSANKIVPPEEIEHAKKHSTELSFRQEWLAEFISDAGAVFRNITACIRHPGRYLGNGPHEIIAPDKDRFYHIAVDLAKHTDFTVITVMDDQGRLCYFDRFNNLDWTIQCEKIVNVCNKYPMSKLILDSTGIGDPIFDFLSRLRPVDAFKFTNETKTNLVSNLSICLENMAIQYPDIPIMLDELRAFTYERSDSGRFKYGAPDGKHDDCVMSLALATWSWRQTQTDEVTFVLADGKELFGRKYSERI